MYDQCGVDGDIEWRVSHLYNGNFEITVSDDESIDSEYYKTEHPIEFGIDMADQREINYILDSMINKLRGDYH